MTITAGTKYEATRSAKTLERRALRCASLRVSQFAQGSFTANRSASMMKLPAGVQRSAGDFVAGRLFNRHRFTGHHRFIDGACAFADHAVDRNAFAGTNSEPIPRAPLD